MTIRDAAKRLGMLERQVRRWCERLGYRRVGRDYHLTAAQVAKIVAKAEKAGAK